MKFAKSILTGTGAVVLAGLILALLAPKAAHAIAATAVQVMNTTSTPVPNQDVDAPGRSPFAQLCWAASSSSCTLLPAVPAGKEFVVETISAFMAASASFSGIAPVFSIGNVETHGVVLNAIGNAALVTMLPPIGNNGFSAAMIPVTIYEDSGNTPQANLVSLTPGYFSATLTGHLVTLP
jgi:hypothetical protein